MKSGCVCGSGCSFNRELVWTSSLPDETISSNLSLNPSLNPSSKQSSNPSLQTCSKPANMHACSTISDSSKHIALCGGGFTTPECSSGYDFSAENSNKYGVTCCSDCMLPGWTKNEECEVWVSSEVGLSQTCQGQASKTYQEARCICEQSGARLCTKGEIVNECAADTGCNMNSQTIWTSTTLGPTYDFFPFC